MPVVRSFFFENAMTINEGVSDLVGLFVVVDYVDPGIYEKYVRTAVVPSSTKTRSCEIRWLGLLKIAPDCCFIRISTAYTYQILTLV